VGLLKQNINDACHHIRLTRNEGVGRTKVLSSELKPIHHSDEWRRLILHHKIERRRRGYFWFKHSAGMQIFSDIPHVCVCVCTFRQMVVCLHWSNVLLPLRGIAPTDFWPDNNILKLGRFDRILLHHHHHHHLFFLPLYTSSSLQHGTGLDLNDAFSLVHIHRVPFLFHRF
jgi:hypothetical protein